MSETGNIPYIPAGPVGSPRPAPPATPELDKRSKIINSDAHKGVIAFLDWIDGDPNHDLRLVHENKGEVMGVYSNEFERILARFYGLDPQKIAAEQEALMAYMRELNTQ